MSGVQAERDNWELAKPHNGIFLPIIVSVVAGLIWLIFILFYALFWSGGYNLFQDFVVFFVTLFITAIAIGLVWLVWGRNQWHWWRGQNW